MTEQNTRFEFTEFPILETPRLRLRRMTARDVDDVFAIFGDAETCRFLIDQGCEPLQSPDEAKAAVIDWSTQRFLDKRGLRWALTTKDDDRLIGTAGFNNWHEVDHRADIGYDLVSSQWGRGFMTEAVHALLQFGFQRMDLNRIEADVTEGNEASIRVLQKCGFTEEGTWRHKHFARGQFHDLLQFSVLRDEYLATV